MIPTFETPYPVFGHPFSRCVPHFASLTNSFIYPSSASIVSVLDENAALRSWEGRIDSRPAELVILIILLGNDDTAVAFCNNGNIAFVSANVPKKFVDTVISACLSKGVLGTVPYKVGSLKQTAALLIRTSHRPYFSSIFLAAIWMESISCKSIFTKSILLSDLLFPSVSVSDFNCSTAARPNSSFRQPKIHIKAPFLLSLPSVLVRVWDWSSLRAISKPIPLLDPVIKAIF
mmetsp:Transcript_63980/g.72385  ORF Transcript_63980/g.72385 Transcript_63980/m.72385 type:complete len:232 (-) Transcript_63980:170-865(-)